jgi:hypothetical protein
MVEPLHMLLACVRQVLHHDTEMARDRIDAAEQEERLGLPGPGPGSATLVSSSSRGNHDIHDVNHHLKHTLEAAFRACSSACSRGTTCTSLNEGATFCVITHLEC